MAIVLRRPGSPGAFDNNSKPVVLQHETSVIESCQQALLSRGGPENRPQTPVVPGSGRGADQGAAGVRGGAAMVGGPRQRLVRETGLATRRELRHLECREPDRDVPG